MDWYSLVAPKKEIRRLTNKQNDVIELKTREGGGKEEGRENTGGRSNGNEAHYSTTRNASRRRMFLDGNIEDSLDDDVEDDVNGDDVSHMVS